MISDSLGFVSLRSNQIAILQQAILNNKDCIWNAACNAGKTILPWALGIMSSLGLHGFGEHTTIIHFVPSTALILNMFAATKKVALLRDLVCVPGHEEHEHLSLRDAIRSTKYRYIIMHVSKLVYMCGHGKRGTIDTMSSTQKCELAQDLLKGPFKDQGKNLKLVFDEAQIYMQLPFEDIAKGLELINIFCKNANKYVITATMLTVKLIENKAQMENNETHDNIILSTPDLINFFHLNPKKVYARTESSRRPGILRLIINLSNIFSAKALENPSYMQRSCHLVNIHILHKYAILLGGILLVHCAL